MKNVLIEYIFTGPIDVAKRLNFHKYGSFNLYRMMETIPDKLAIYKGLKKFRKDLPSILGYAYEADGKEEWFKITRVVILDDEQRIDYVASFHDNEPPRYC